MKKNWRQGLKETPAHTVCSSTIHRGGSNPIGHGQIHGIFTYMEYYSVFKRKKIPIHATTWMNFGNIILRKSYKKTNIV